jgi:transposase
MSKKYIVRLTEEERKGLEDLVSKGKAAAYKIKHAHILLKANVDGPNWEDKRIAEAFSVHVGTVGNVRQRLVEEGMEAALGRKKRAHPPCEQILDGKGEARLIALTRGKPPEGHCRWTLRLLADKMVELKIADSVSYETVRRTLKKTNSSLTCEIAG